MTRDSGNRLHRLLEPIHDNARAFARRICRSNAEGDDVFHDAVVRAHAKVADLRDDGAFRTWFYRVIVTVQRTRSRRGFWRRLIPLAGHETVANGSMDQIGSSERARIALGELPPVQREAVVLFELEGFTVDEVARVQEVSPSAVKSRLARGRGRLRTIYIKRFGFEAEDTTPLPTGTNR